MLPLLLVFSCAKKPAADTPTPPQVVDGAVGTTAELDPADRAVVRFHMMGHAAKATEARDALIRGDIESARDAMLWLSEHREAAGTPDSWAAPLAAMQVSAEDGSLAADVPEMALALGETAAQCGSCHAAEGAELPWTATPPPPATDDPARHMQRHAWAVERMWASLVMPDRDAWRQSLMALSDPGLDSLAVGAGASQADTVADAAEAVHALVPEGVQAPPERRAALFGQVVAACASCHQGLGEGP